MPFVAGREERRPANVGAAVNRATIGKQESCALGKVVNAAEIKWCCTIDILCVGICAGKEQQLCALNVRIQTSQMQCTPSRIVHWRVRRLSSLEHGLENEANVRHRPRLGGYDQLALRKQRRRHRHWMEQTAQPVWPARMREIWLLGSFCAVWA